MANRTAVTGNWTAAAGTNTAFGAVATTAADQITIPNGVTVTIVAANTVVCRNLTVAAGGTLVFAATTSVVTIGDATAGTSNVALSVSATAAITLTGIGTINLISTSATQQTIASGGKTLPNLTINGVGSSYLLSADLTLSGTLTITSGTFDANNKNLSASIVNASGSAARTVTMGSGTWSLTYTFSTNVWSTNTTTNLTLNSNTAVIAITTASSVTRTFAGGGLTFYSLVYTVANSPGALAITGANTFTSLTLDSGRTLTLPASVTNTTRTFTGSGTNLGYLYMPGDQYGASAPDSAALSITDDMDFRIRVALDNIAPSAAFRIAGKYVTTGNQRTWRLYNSVGSLVLDMSTTGSDSSTATASVTLASLGLASGTTYWLRFRRTRSSGLVRFYYAADSATMPSSWTQIGTDRTATTSALFDSTALFTIGADQNSTNASAGKYYWAQMRNNVLDDGTGIQLDAKFQDKAFGDNSFTEGSSNAATVTVNTSSSTTDGRLAINSATPGTPAYFSKPSDGMLSTDYLVIKDIRASQPFMFWAGANSISTSGNANIYFTAPSGTYRHQQSAAMSISAASVAATFPATTTAGNLLVAYVMTSASTGGGVVAPSGWTQAAISSQTVVGYVYYKIASGSETTVTYAQTTSRTLVMQITEFSGFSGTPTLDVTDNNNTTSSVTTLSTTATTGPTNSAQPALAVTFWAFASTPGASVSFTDSFSEDYTYGSTTGSLARVAVKELTSTAAVSSTFTWTTARANDVTVLAVFKDAALANGNFFQFFN